jgi:hypothetical protein
MSSYSVKIFAASVFLCVLAVVEVNGHGRLIDPPARSTAWRFGYDTPVNYDDNQLYCGGKQVQWEQNGGKCGVCGDNWSGVREHESPNGKYTPTPLRITGNYASGSILEAVVELTTSHLGFFTFKMCPDTSDKREVTQECLDKHLLYYTTKAGEMKDKYPIHEEGRMERGSGIYKVPLRLPNNVTCDRCVLQWTYTTGNSWGVCPDGTKETGCGPQETFRGCSDILIYDRYSVSPNRELDESENEITDTGIVKRRIRNTLLRRKISRRR